MNAQMQETLSVNGALLTKIFGRHDYEYGRFDEHQPRRARSHRSAGS